MEAFALEVQKSAISGQLTGLEEAAHSLKSIDIKWDSINADNIEEVIKAVSVVPYNLAFFRELHDYIVWDFPTIAALAVYFIKSNQFGDDTWSNWIREHTSIEGRVNECLLAKLLGSLEEIGYVNFVVEELIGENEPPWSPERIAVLLYHCNNDWSMLNHEVCQSLGSILHYCNEYEAIIHALSLIDPENADSWRLAIEDEDEDFF